MLTAIPRRLGCRCVCNPARPLVAATGLALAVAVSMATVGRAEDSTQPPKNRSFLFTYAATVTGVEPGKTARVWLPVAPSNEDQNVEVVAKDITGDSRIATEPKFGNRILYTEAKPDENGAVKLSVTYRVTRREVKGDAREHTQAAKDINRFLQADTNVPIEGKPLELIKDKKLPADQMEKARLLYDTVDKHMRYSKEGTGWGRGDAVWACESGYGNCSDFHSLFISLARSQKIPARFEMGFPLPSQHGSGEIPGYHCWARFLPEGHGWIPVDISEANKNPKLRDYYFGNLSENRVMFSVGRDLELVPRQDGKPLNFFIYPYVEVDGKAYDKIEKRFTYKDLGTP
jgi:transglutaminase-like putative cysteine protease